ncbi:MAG: UTP--glucose-1-phosphate uridylyltransferase [Caldilineaceae bacterium]
MDLSPIKCAQPNFLQLPLTLFRHYYEKLLHGDTGFIDSNTAQPVAALPQLNDLADYHAAGKDALQRLVVIKLNGGLGTSMGMTGPNSD